MLSAAQSLEQQREVAHLIKDFFSDKPVRKVWLFGSFARGDFDEDSDVDILIKWDYDQESIGWEYFGWWEDLEELTGRKVDLVSHGYVSKYLKPYIEQEKILVYEKD